MIEFACEKCGKSFKVPDNLAGKTGTCKQCGAPMRIPAAETFDVIQTAPPARPAPPAPPAPMAPPAPQINVGVSIPQPAPGKGTSGLGVAAVVLGILALLSCWIPLLNLGSFLLAVVGGVLGLVGTILAMTGKKSGPGWPVAGVLVNGMAAAGVVAFNLLFAGAAATTGKAFADAVVEAKKATDKAQEKVKAIRAAEVPTAEDVGKAVEVQPAQRFGTARFYRKPGRNIQDLGGMTSGEAGAKILAIEGDQAEVEISGGKLDGVKGWFDLPDLRIPKGD